MSYWNTQLRFHCTVAWCATEAGVIDRGMGVHGCLWLSGADYTAGDLEDIRETIVQTIDHRPVDAEEVLGEAEVAQRLLATLKEILQGRVDPVKVELEIVPGAWWEYTW